MTWLPAATAACDADPVASVVSDARDGARRVLEDDRHGALGGAARRDDVHRHGQGPRVGRARVLARVVAGVGRGRRRRRALTSRASGRRARRRATPAARRRRSRTRRAQRRPRRGSRSKPSGERRSSCERKYTSAVRVVRVTRTADYISPTMTTEKLYWADPTPSPSRPVGARAATWNGRASSCSIRTLFYPESGGQLADPGTLTGAIARSVTTCRSTTPGPSITSSPARRPEGVTAWRRDRSRAAARLHGAAHRAARALAGARRPRAGRDRVVAPRGDVLHDRRRGRALDGDVARAEDLVNAVVQGDVTVRPLFPTPEELPSAPAARPEGRHRHSRHRDRGVRMSPCGGTHCTRTGQIGAMRVVGVERYKGKLPRDVPARAARWRMRAARRRSGRSPRLHVRPARRREGRREAPRRAQGRDGRARSLRGELVARVADATWARTRRPEWHADRGARARGTTSRCSGRWPADWRRARTSWHLRGAGRRGGRRRGRRAAGRVGDFDCGAWLKEAAEKSGGAAGGGRSAPRGG